jgi:hypothetical protein
MSTTRSFAAASFAAMALLAPAAAQAARPSERPLARTHFTAPTAGEARLALTAAARGADWGIAGRESAVLTVRVDGRYSQDVVLFEGARRFTYGVAIGPVGPGRHTIGVTFNRAKSPPAVRKAKVKDLAPSLAPAATSRPATPRSSTAATCPRSPAATRTTAPTSR